MGGALSKAIKSIDGSTDAEKETKDALDSLFELGKSRNDAALAHATSNTNTFYAPIDKVLLQRQSIVASASTSADDIVNSIKDSVGSLMKGQILDGFVPPIYQVGTKANMSPRVTNIIGSLLKVVLGESAGRVSQESTYALVATDLGALMRIDVDIYSFSIVSEGLQKHAKDMTAVTAIISSVKPQGITLGDIRAVVSLSYGSSPLETQQKIFEIVKAAWENDRKSSAGATLSVDDVQNVQNLFVPSQHEEDMKRRNTLGVPQVVASRKEKIGRRQFLDAISAPTSEVGTMSIQDLSSGDKSVDVFLWVEINHQADESWFRYMENVLRGFEAGNGFKYVKISGGQSGTAVSFQCRIGEKAFSTGIQYFEDTILPSIRGAVFISSIISHMGLQYTHPSESGSSFPTRVVYKQNLLTNTTPDTVNFYAPRQSKPFLTIAPNGSGVLDGPVAYVTGALPTQIDTGNTPEWATYQKIQAESIIMECAASLHLANGGGYAIKTHTNNDKEVHVIYDQSWRGESGKDDNLPAPNPTPTPAQPKPTPAVGQTPTKTPNPNPNLTPAPNLTPTPAPNPTPAPAPNPTPATGQVPAPIPGQNPTPAPSS